LCPVYSPSLLTVFRRDQHVPWPLQPFMLLHPYTVAVSVAEKTWEFPVVGERWERRRRRGRRLEGAERGGLEDELRSWEVSSACASSGRASSGRASSGRASSGRASSAWASSGRWLA